METIKISDADARHKELMAGIGAIERALLLINDALRLRVVEVEGLGLKIGSRVFVPHASFEGEVVAQTENAVKVLHADTPGYCVWFSKRDVELIGETT